MSHLFFSQRTPYSLTGNLMGDFKPSDELRGRLPEPVLLGIQNHKLVDKTTDQFQAVKDLRPLFLPERRRFSGVISDIVFDYFLIKHWDTLATVDFDDFLLESYQGLEQCTDLMPARMVKVVEQMIKRDWLRSYSTLKGVAIALDQVSRRIRFENKMAGAISEVENNYDSLESVFFDLFTHISAAVSQASIEA